MTTESTPRLSIVATSRNDDHGGGLLNRMQTFVNALIGQCTRHALPAELILVEWNPPADRPPLSEALKWPEDLGPCDVRIITVPPEHHLGRAHADALPLFQMIAKNVGIRRARANFVLATNIDLVFSDALCSFLATARLRRRRVYRVDRYDVDPKVPVAAPADEQLRYCEANVWRINRAGCTEDLRTGEVYVLHDNRVLKSLRAMRKWRVERMKRLWVMPRLHTNACGDFTLLSREDWLALQGYPELEMYSFHIDSLLCMAAHYNRLREVRLPDPMRAYHIEHGIGSGWSREGEAQLNARLEAAGIPRLTDEDLRNYAREFKRAPKPIRFNDDTWGLHGRDLEETAVGPALAPATRAVSAS